MQGCESLFGSRMMGDMSESHWREWSYMHKKNHSRAASRILVLDSESYRSDHETLDLYNFLSFCFSSFIWGCICVSVQPAIFSRPSYEGEPPCYNLICVPVRIVLYKVIVPLARVLRQTDHRLNSIQQYPTLDRNSRMTMSELAKTSSTSWH